MLFKAFVMWHKCSYWPRRMSDEVWFECFALRRSLLREGCEWFPVWPLCQVEGLWLLWVSLSCSLLLCLRLKQFLMLKYSDRRRTAVMRWQSCYSHVPSTTPKPSVSLLPPLQQVVVHVETWINFYYSHFTQTNFLKSSEAPSDKITRDVSMKTFTGECGYWS